MRYEVDRLAYTDLQELYRWGSQEFGEARADGYYDGLVNIFELLADNPRMGRRFSVKYRYLAHQSHVVVYRVLPNDHIRIVRVLGGHEDWRRQLD